MARSIALLLALLGVIGMTSGKVFTRCELAQTLKAAGLTNLGHWVCLAEAESSRRTDATNTNTNGSKDYGIFQINDNYWCSPPSTHNDCNVQCSNLINDNISDDIACAKIIYNRHQFEAWYGWIAKCKGKDVSGYIAGCGV